MNIKFLLVPLALLSETKVLGKKPNTILRARKLQITESPSSTMSPSSAPTVGLSQSPSYSPDMMPSELPSGLPSSQPSQSSDQPSMEPSMIPSGIPSSLPTGQPSWNPSDQPNKEPSSKPSDFPSKLPSAEPSQNPSSLPSIKPSKFPSSSPTMVPSRNPSTFPSSIPSISMEPSKNPSLLPSYNPDKKSNVDGLVVEILGKSGKMNIENNNRTVQITMDGLREVDSDGNIVGNTGKKKHSIQSFANQPFIFGLRDYYSTLFTFNSTTNNTIPEAAKGLRIDFSSTLDTGSKLKVQAFLVQEGGVAGDAKGNWTVSSGDFKWNIWFENWIWYSSAAFVELDIEVKGANTAPTPLIGNATYELGDTTTLDIRSDYELSNGTAVSMPNGYPLMTTQGSKTIFTFKFAKHGNLDMKYDPLISFAANSNAPTVKPSIEPSLQPSTIPTSIPSRNPSSHPITIHSSGTPSISPSVKSNDLPSFSLLPTAGISSSPISVRSLFKLELLVECPFSETQLQVLMNSLKTSITALINVSDTISNVTVTSTSSIECQTDSPQNLRYLSIQALDFIVETLSEAKSPNGIPFSTEEVIELIEKDVSSDSTSLILSSASLSTTQQIQFSSVEIVESTSITKNQTTIAPSASSTSAGNSMKTFQVPMVIVSYILYVL